MKHLVLAIGIFAVSVWRALANLVVSVGALSPAQARMAEPATMRIHVARGVDRDGDGIPVLLGHRPGAARSGDRADLHRAADRAAARRRLPARAASAARSIAGFARRLRRRCRHRARPGAGAARRPMLFWARVAILGSALCYAVQHRPDAASGARREAARDHLLPGRSTVMLLWLLALPFAGVPAWPAGQWQLDRGRVGALDAAAPCCSPGPMREAKRAISPSPNIAPSSGRRRLAGWCSTSAYRSTRSPARC